MLGYGGLGWRQKGVVLLASLVFLLVLSLIGLGSMQAAVSQQRAAGSVWHRNQSFQSAESGLRLGESIVRKVGGALPMCRSINTCAPPEESYSVVRAGMNAFSAVTWVAAKGGLYGVQSLGQVDAPSEESAALYRVTAVGLLGQSRTVLEAVYARVDEEGGTTVRRVLWRQLQ